jgi:hypothetical protein
MKDDEKHPITSIVLSTLFGILPGIGFALSIYISLAVVTLIARAVHILG